MAQLTLNIPNDKVQLVLDTFGYQATIDGQPNPQTPNQFMKQVIINYVKGNVRQYEESKVVVEDIPIT